MLALVLVLAEDVPPTWLWGYGVVVYVLAVVATAVVVAVASYKINADYTTCTKNVCNIW